MSSVSGVARNGEVQIAYESFGEASGEPLLLLSGLDAQMLWWPEGWIDELVRAGFHVVRFDNRDSGLSTHFTGRGPAYRAEDMLDDALAVMDDVGWAGAHLVGLSMGAGMAQGIAILHPQRVRSLTLMGAVPVGDVRSMMKYVKFGSMLKAAFKRYPKDRDGRVRQMIDVVRLTFSPGYPFDEQWARQTAQRCFDRKAPDPRTRQRQLAASTKIRIPAPGLAGVAAPTVVLSGQSDRLIKSSGSKAVAKAIPGARLVAYPDMGHMFPAELWPQIVGEIRAVADQAAVGDHQAT